MSTVKLHRLFMDKETFVCYNTTAYILTNYRQEGMELTVLIYAAVLRIDTLEVPECRKTAKNAHSLVGM